MKQMTEQHMINALGGESMANMRYRHFAVQAEKEGFTNAARLFRAVADAEYIHKTLYENAKEAVDAGRDVELGTVQVCDVGGYTLEGEAPDRCPVCNAKKERFTAYPG